MKKFLEEGGKKSVMLSIGEEQIGGGIHIEKRERGGVVKKDVDPYIIRVKIKQRKRGRKFRER